MGLVLRISSCNNHGASVAAAILRKSKEIYRNLDLPPNKDSSNKDNSPIYLCTDGNCMIRSVL